MRKNVNEKNFIKIKFKDFLNENRYYKINDTYYYKNQYMTDSEEVSIIDINEFTDGTISSITIKIDDDNITLLPHEFEYLTKEKPQKSDYEIFQLIKNQINDLVNYNPKQLTDLFNFKKNDKYSDTINIIFTEEIKDGRSSSFDVNKPLVLKGKILGVDNFKIEIINIKFDKTINQESDYNEYIDYVYNVKIRKVK